MRSHTTLTAPALTLWALLSNQAGALPATTNSLSSTGAAAAAAAVRRDVSPPTPPKDQEFSLAMQVDGTYVSLTATYNGTSDIVLKAGRMSVYPGTPGMSTTLLPPLPIPHGE